MRKIDHPQHAKNKGQSCSDQKKERANDQTGTHLGNDARCRRKALKEGLRIQSTLLEEYIKKHQAKPLRFFHSASNSVICFQLPGTGLFMNGSLPDNSPQASA